MRSPARTPRGPAALALALALAAGALTFAALVAVGGCGGGRGATGPTSQPAPGFQFGTPGPWPTQDTVWSASSGLDPDVVDVSTDEAQDIWAAGPDAIYLLRPGDTQFQRIGATEGLHLANADPPGITALAGGAAHEAWVGYQGAPVVDPQRDADRTRGKLDRVLVGADGTVTVDHYDVHNNDAVGFDANGNVLRLPDGQLDPQYTDWSFNENRSVVRFLYDHLYHRGSLYVGFQHGVDRIDAGHVDAITGFDYSDHVHPLISDATGTPRMGEWRGLALDPSPRHDAHGRETRGLLWMGGRWTAGAIAWTQTLFDWPRNDRNPFWLAFATPPVFPVAAGASVYISGIAALSDGTVYFASGPGEAANYAPLGIARWTHDGGPGGVLDPIRDLHLPGSDIIDLQRLPDDTVLVALPSGVWRWDPRRGPPGTLLGQLHGLPGSQVRRLYVDPMVKPTAVYVATDGGIAMLRVPDAP